MIPNQWYAVLESNEVPAGKVVGVTRLGERLVFWRDAQDKVSCLRDFCPHRGVALRTGKVLGDHIQCPFHGFEFDTSGRCTLIPANGRSGPISREMKAFDYPTHEAHGFIFIWWGKPTGALPPPPWFTDIDESFSYATVRDPWEAHYSRAIENQLDVVHVPFIHYNTIGRRVGAVVDGPIVDWLDEDRFRIYMRNRADDGTPPVRSRDMTRPDSPFWLEFIFPNLWQNHLGAKARVVIAFVPVDDEHSVLYLRQYQRFIQTPILRDIVNRLSMPLNTLIAHQDRRVVVTQLPKRTALKMGEKLIQGDGPIIEYRRRREALIAAAQA
jgi:phenylpropionate dioxygenase-like ring-hydroxylating dioxygenase large terminal subunit